MTDAPHTTEPPTRGTRVRLRPHPGSDVMDLALTGRVAEVEDVREDLEGRRQVVVTLSDDPGRDFTTGLGHRFYFSPEELEPLTGQTDTARVLVAGIGNVFLADDGFGPATVAALLEWLPQVPAGAHVADFGIRGMDLAYRLLEGYDVAVLVDAAPRGGTPGDLYLIEPDLETVASAAPEAHGMDPVRVMALAEALSEGESLPRLLVLGCEPLVRMTGDEPDVDVGLSEPVRDATGRAAEELRDLLPRLLRDPATRLETEAEGR
ncbi:hydrogenase maturation protease [Streptomyces sp. NPDC005438]|uniref:hydrogenase maturation protease n=1 Tax=Streptomyces sp. NPDC005438 TaxID=3156880 RepID=UPI0033A65C5A